jgi:hypothetical protein
MPDSPADPFQEKVQAADIDEAGCRIGESSLEQDVVGLVLAEHIIDEVGGDRHLAPGLLLTRMAALDQARDDGAHPEGALHQARLGKPGVEVVAEHVLVEESAEVEPSVPHHLAHVVEPPDGERIFIGDETERGGARPLEPAGEQHAEALMGKAPLERIAD